MTNRLSNPMLEVLLLLLQPVVRFCVRRGVSFQDFHETAKVAFIDAAAREIDQSGKRINISKLSVVTGIHRKDVVRIYRDQDIQDSPAHVAARVVTRWRKDRKFVSSNGRPRVLSFRGEDSEFSSLVRLISTDLRAGAVLFDLERVGAVERTANGLRLKARAYMPTGDPIQGMKLLAGDTEDLMEAVLDNVFSGSDDRPNYHGNFAYDNISEEDIPKIREWLFKQCAALHRKASKYLSKFDLDLHPSESKQGGKRVSVLICTRT